MEGKKRKKNRFLTCNYEHHFCHVIVIVIVIVIGDHVFV